MTTRLRSRDISHNPSTSYPIMKSSPRSAATPKSNGKFCRAAHEHSAACIPTIECATSHSEASLNKIKPIRRAA
jgi:hypothetical protein